MRKVEKTAIASRHGCDVKMALGGGLKCNFLEIRSEHPNPYTTANDSNMVDLNDNDNIDI